MAKKIIDLLFSDVTYGCKEYGFIPRPSRDVILGLPCDECASDEEDRMYEKYLKEKDRGFDLIVIDGQIWIS